MGAAHVEALRRVPGVEVVAIASGREARACALAEAWRIPKVCRDPYDLIGDHDVDVVHNCTPNDLHLPLNRAALEAGKHVLSEKPLARNSAETAALVEIAERRGLVAAVNHSYRYYPLVQHARRTIQSGTLGRVYLVHGAYLQDWLLYRSDYNWRVEPERGGPSRVLGDIGTHWCDLAQHITGRRITEVCAQKAIVHPTRLKPATEADTARSADPRQAEAEIARPTDQRDAIEVPVVTEDFAAVLARFEDGARGMFAVSQVSAGHKNGLVVEIDCAEGALRWEQEDANHLWIGRRNRPNEILEKDPSLIEEQARPYARYPGGHPEGYPDGFRNLFANVYAHIADRGIPPEFPTFRESHQVMKVIEAIATSDREGRWVEVDAS
jgi:predicted dehydrogenase